MYDKSCHQSYHDLILWLDFENYLTIKSIFSALNSTLNIQNEEVILKAH